MQIASLKEVNFSPYQLSRILLEHLCQVPKKVVSSFVKDSTLILRTKPKKTNNAVPLDRKRLQHEFLECVELDEYCSPYVDRIRRTIGLEYEFILQEKLRNLSIPFESEEKLRERGFAKTPDILLRVPFCIAEDAGRVHVVNWIDSKAMFGDPATHQGAKSQFRAYCNRFGSGLVLYWFGFVASLNADDDVLLMDRMPVQKRIIRLQSTSLRENVIGANGTED